MTYRIDLFDAAGRRVAILQGSILTSLNLDHAVDAAPEITLSLPVDDPKSAYISALYHLKVWNTQTSEYEFSVFKLLNPEIEDNDGALEIKATYQGILTRLSDEHIEVYDTTSAGAPFATVITALLAFQVNSPAITVGTLEISPTVAIAIESGNIYGSLNSIRKAYGGWFEVDALYRLNWYADNTAAPQRRIERRKNLKAITYTPQYDQIINRVYAYGKGEGDARINLVDAGEANEYIEDVASQAAYGVVARQRIDKSITHPDTLLKYAQRILAQYKDPPYQYSVDVLNLAELKDYDYSFESLGLDTRVRVIDDLLNVDVNTSIVSMSINLLNPEEIQIELSTIKNDLSDLFGDILSLQDISNSVATQIGAGQVTVLGTFVVQDWVTGGTTTIDGGNITANTITVSQLNFTPVDSTNVVASINASSEGIDIIGARIRIDGNTTFSSGYDPTDKIGIGGGAADINTNTTTINGGKITTNTITATQIAANTITATQIAANTITATQIAANTISVTELNFTPVYDDNVVATINASSEGLVIDADKLSINGDVAISTGQFGQAFAGLVIESLNTTAEFNKVYFYGTTWVEITDNIGLRSGMSGYTPLEPIILITVSTFPPSSVSTGNLWIDRSAGTPTYDDIYIYRGAWQHAPYDGLGRAYIDHSGDTWGANKSRYVIFAATPPGFSISGSYWVNTSSSGRIKLTADLITLDGVVETTDSIGSQNYAVGSAGWQIDGDGNAEFNNVVMRGNLAACKITAGQSLDITDTGILRVVGTSGVIGLYNNSSDTYPVVSMQNYAGNPSIVLRSSGSTAAPIINMDESRILLRSTLGSAINISRGDSRISLSNTSGGEAVRLLGPEGEVWCDALVPSGAGVGGTITLKGDLSATGDISCDDLACDGLHFNNDGTNTVLYSNGTHLYFRDSGGTIHTLV